MRIPKIVNRSSRTIVQQMNVQNTKSVLSDIANNRPIDVNSRSGIQSYDCDDQANVDFDKFDPNSPLFCGFESLIDQHCRASEIYEHFKPKKPAASEPSPVQVTPVVDPPSAE